MQERVQVLYWLKTNQANSVGHLAALVGRHPTTVSRWLSKYRRGGLKALLTIESSPGRPATIPPFAIALLKEELSDPEGFSSYGEILSISGFMANVEPLSGESFFWEFCHNE